jgi:hypothetical protein
MTRPTREECEMTMHIVIYTLGDTVRSLGSAPQGDERRTSSEGGIGTGQQGCGCGMAMAMASFETGRKDD